MRRFSERLAAHFGSRCDWGFVMLFSIRLDESGTDGKSGFVTVGGAVAAVPDWDELEDAWRAKLKPRGIEFFHLSDFDDRKPPYRGWSATKCALFENSLRGIIRHHTLFRCAVSVESAAHAEVKKKMQGIRPFHQEADYGLCLRYLLHHTGDVLAKIDPDFELDVMVERGPWTAGAQATFNHIADPGAKLKPTKHAHRLGAFAAFPKGKFASLDAADLIVGREHSRLMMRAPASPREELLAHVLDAGEMGRFYEMMMEEKEARRAFNRDLKGAA